jgi:hypothetical protein
LYCYLTLPQTLVQEVRNIQQGTDRVVLVDQLPRGLIPRSVQFRSLTDPSARLSEQT